MNWIDKMDNGMKIDNPSSAETEPNSYSGDLIISTVPVVGEAVIGIVPCPGRNQVDTGDPRWHRELEADLTTLEAWGANALVSLVEAHEFPRLGVPNFGEAVRRRNFRWHHLPIVDMAPPGSEFQNAWNVQGDQILQGLKGGERVVVHCAGGLGRSGMIAAKLLAIFGTPRDEAIAKVREARPGAIETSKQENYVLAGPPLSVRG